MSRWPTEALGELLIQRLEEYRIPNPSAETFVTVRLHGRGAVRREIADGKAPVMRSGYRLIAGDLVYSRIDARNGAFAIVPQELTGAVVSKDFPCFAIKKDRAHPSFLIRFLGSELFYGQLRASSFGTTNRQRLGEQTLLGYQIPLPPLSEQKRIVRILDEAEALRRLRRQAVVRTNDLIPAMFNEMFSEPVFSSRDWRLLKVRDAVNLVNGRAFGPSDWGQEGLPIIRIQNLKDSQAPFNYFSGHLDPKFLVSPGAILISWAGQLVSFGVHVWNGPQGALNQHIFRVDPRVEFENAFLQQALSQVVERAKKSFQGNEMKHLTKGPLEEAMVLCPPLPLQREFGVRVAEIHELKTAQAASRKHLDDLFQSLLHRAFEGEL